MENKRNITAIKNFDETEKDNLKEICLGSWFMGPVYDDIFHSLPHPLEKKFNI